MLVLFLHGLGIKTGGTCPMFFRKRGFEVVEPALPHGDFNESVWIARCTFDRHRPDVVVGHCRGGAVAMSIDANDTPLVLIAPAWRKWGDVRCVKPSTLVLHCERDKVIPVVDSRELVRSSGLPESALWIVGMDHFMTDTAALETQVDAVNEAVLPLRVGSESLTIGDSGSRTAKARALPTDPASRDEVSRSVG